MPFRSSADCQVVSPGRRQATLLLARSEQNARSTPGTEMQDAQAVQDWLRIHRQLIEFESAFSDLAIRAARGELPLSELDEQRTLLEATRELCTAAYERAFPRAVNR